MTQRDKKFSNTPKSINYRKNIWLEQCINAHGNKFDYSKIDFKNQSTKVEIVCKTHGSFLQTPADHVRTKHGCPKCGIESNIKICRESGFYKQSGKRLNESLTTEQRKKNAEKTKKTRISKGHWVPDEVLSEWELYKKKVRCITENQNLSLLENFDQRRQGKGAYNLDHMYSIYEGFQNNIPPEIIGNIANLRMIKFEENREKGIKSCITIEELLRRINDNLE